MNFNQFAYNNNQQIPLASLEPIKKKSAQQGLTKKHIHHFLIRPHQLRVRRSSPRLLNGTFLENLLFGLPEDPQKLQDTLESCALLQDQGCRWHLAVPSLVSLERSYRGCVKYSEFMAIQRAGYHDVP